MILMVPKHCPTHPTSEADDLSFAVSDGGETVQRAGDTSTVVVAELAHALHHVLQVRLSHLHGIDNHGLMWKTGASGLPSPSPATTSNRSCRSSRARNGVAIRGGIASISTFQVVLDPLVRNRHLVPSGAAISRK